MRLAHRIRLEPTPLQAAYFLRASTVARFAHNWALAEWQRGYATGARPREVVLRRRLNAIKRIEFPWMLEVGKVVPQQAIKNLGNSYINFFEDLRKYRRRELPWKRVRRPCYARKGAHDSFRVDNGIDKDNYHAVTVEGKRVRVPRLGWVRMREAVRFCGRICSLTISREADKWYASFAVEVKQIVPARGDNEVVGVDLGSKHLATLSDGRRVPAPKPLKHDLAKLRRLNRALSRKSKGSRNWAKAKTKLARLHARIKHVRADCLHKLTTTLVRDWRTVSIEDLNVAGMLANRKLARTISDLGFFEFRRQLQYKAAMQGASIFVAPQWFASSKICSACGWTYDALTLSEREWTCRACAKRHDRDINAAINLRNAASSAVAVCGAGGSGDGHQAGANPTALKQKETMGSAPRIRTATPVPKTPRRCGGGKSDTGSLSATVCISLFKKKNRPRQPRPVS